MQSPPPGDIVPLRRPPAVPDHELLRCIGHGSYGDVWLARNVLGQFRAVKFIYRSRFSDPRPFEREFEGIQRFEPISRSHPSQLAILHVGKNDPEGCFYYVMELADAVNTEGPKPKSDSSSSFTLDSRRYSPHTLRSDLEQQGRLSIVDCVQIGLALTTALAHLNEQGLVHRDIKPSNVIFVNGVAKLGDIGLVTHAGDTQSIVGTEGYLPPEGPGTPQADIYSLGKVLYEISTGMDRRQLPKLPSALRTWQDGPGVLELNEIVVKACASLANERYPNADAMRVDLARMQDGVSLRQMRQAEHRWSSVRRASKWVFVAGIVIALGVVAARWDHQTNAQVPERRSTNELANRSYDLGLHLNERLESDDAMANYKKAIEADPYFASPRAELGLLYVRNGGRADQRMFHRLARKQAEVALKLEPSLPLPHVVLAWCSILEAWRWDDAEHQMQQALRLAPQSARIQHANAEFLRCRGRIAEAITALRHGLALEPRSVRLNLRMPPFMMDARRYREALEQVDYVMRMEPSIPLHWRRAEALCALGDYEKAIEAERDQRLSAGQSRDGVERQLQPLRTAFAADGRRGYWRWKLDELQRNKESLYYQARAHAQIGDFPKAIECLRSCLETTPFDLAFGIAGDWALDPLRSRPDFKALLKEMHLE